MDFLSLHGKLQSVISLMLERKQLIMNFREIVVFITLLSKTANLFRSMELSILSLVDFH